MNYTGCHIISGCSGGGKSSLISALAEKGWIVIMEAGRQVVRNELATGGTALPWDDALGFVEKSVALSLLQTKAVFENNPDSPVLSDRSIVDVISYLDYRGIKTPTHLKGSLSEIRYATTVFISPPWSELFICDAERTKSFEEAVLEYDHLCEAYLKLGYKLVEIPRCSIVQRVSFIEPYLRQ